METAAYIDVLDREGRLLALAATGSDPHSPVPGCPGWRLTDLLAHVGGVHRWAAYFVSTGAARPDRPEEEFFAVPEGADPLDQFRDGHAALVRALREADPALSCWSFLPAPSPLAFWARRQAHETTIHRVDAESAAGCTPHRIEPPFGADGIDELLNGFHARRRSRLVADPPVRLAVRASDADAAWTVHIEPDGRRVLPGAGDADLTLTGPAADLYLLLWNRGGGTGVTADGDTSVLDVWRGLSGIRWS